MSRRVLLIRFSSLGDVILTEPLVRGLRHPGSPAGTVLLTRERFAGLFRAHPDLHAVWTLEESPGVRQLRARATAGGFDEVIDLHRSLRSRALTAALDIPVRRFRTHRLRRAMLAARQPLKRRMPVPPVTDRYMEAAGIDPPAGAGRWPALRLPEEV
ncbi:MAG: hypothetical protein R6W82_06600, partial [bacterium]